MVFYSDKKTAAEMFSSFPGRSDHELDRTFGTVTQRYSYDPLFAWELEIFTVCGRKCMQVMNILTRFSLFIFDPDESKPLSFQQLMKDCLTDMFQGDPSFCRAIEKCFGASTLCIFKERTDSDASDAMREIRNHFSCDAERFAKSVKSLHDAKELNLIVNYNLPQTLNVFGRSVTSMSGHIYHDEIINRFNGN